MRRTYFSEGRVLVGKSPNGQEKTIHIAGKILRLAEAFVRLHEGEVKDPQVGPEVLDHLLKTMPKFSELLQSVIRKRKKESFESFEIK